VRAGNIRRWEGGVAFELTLPGVAAPVPVKLAALGDHWIANAALAAAAARWMGLTAEEIAAGFAKVELPAMRMQVSTVNGVRWINDAYNANPDSMRAALRALAAWPCAGRRVAVLGDMLELGAQAEPLHRQIGVEAAAADLALLVTVGPLARFIAAAARARGMAPAAVVECEDVAGAVAVLRDRLKAGDCALLKASRGMKLEPLIEALAR